MEWKPVNTRRDLKKQFNEAKSERLNERHKEQYQESDRKVKRLARADKRVLMDDLASQAEDAASKGEQGKVYKITKVVCSKYHRPTDVPVRDKKGRLVTSETEIDSPWAEHFSEVLNRLPPTAEADVQEAEHDLNVNTAPPDREEIILIIKSHKNRKAQSPNRTSSMQNCSRQPQSLHPRYFSNLLIIRDVISQSERPIRVMWMTLKLNETPVFYHVFITSDKIVLNLHVHRLLKHSLT